MKIHEENILQKLIPHMISIHLLAPTMTQSLASLILASRTSDEGFFHFKIPKIQGG